MTIQEKQQEMIDNGFETGNPTGEIIEFSDGGAMQSFENANIYITPQGDAFEVHGAILGKYIEIGETAGSIGFPASDETDADGQGARVNYFEKGSIVWNMNDGAAVIENEQDAGAGDLSGTPEPMPDEQNTPEHTDQVVSETEITDLDAMLQSAADYAYSLLSMSVTAAKKHIFDNEHPGDVNNWCGNTLANIYKNAGFNARIANTYFASTQGLLDFGSYYQKNIYGHTISKAKKTTVNIDGTDKDLETYHESVNSKRSVILYATLQDGTALDIKPGDIVLLDHHAGGGPDHIQIAYQWDEENRILIVIDGNGGSFVTEEALQKEFNTDDLIAGRHYQTLTADKDITGFSNIEKAEMLEQQLGGRYYLTAAGASGRVSVGCHVLTADHQVNPKTDSNTAVHKRVFAVIRPSVQDFKEHTYKNL